MSLQLHAAGTRPYQRLPVAAHQQQGTDAWRGPAILVALSMLIVPLAFAAAPGSAARGMHWPNPIRSDVDVSGPFLQGHPGDPHGVRNLDRCGEPQITQDPIHPDILVIGCMSQGGLSYQSPAPASYMTWSYKDPTKTVPWTQPCHVFISRDGGSTWTEELPSPIMSRVATACEDPLAASGPQGQLYIGGDADHYPADGKLGLAIAPPPIAGMPGKGLPVEELGIGFTRSLDGGRTWSPPIVIPTPVDRPFWAVDQSTGVIYELSGCVEYDPKTQIGPWGCTPTSRNLAVSTDGGLTWTPSVDPFNKLPPATALTEGRLHDIGGSFIAAARGIVATAGASGTWEGGMGPGRNPYFKYSTHEGRHFVQRPLTLAGSRCAPVSIEGIAADPVRRGTFAVLVACGKTHRSVRVYVTDDLGATWTEAASSLAVLPPPDYRGTPSDFDVNRPWMAYGPTGALGVLWRQAYGTPPVVTLPSIQSGPQDVFLALAPDGETFGHPIRLNTAASPPPDPRIPFGDDISNLALGRHYAYAVWGDWRSGELQTWFRKVPLPRR